MPANEKGYQNDAVGALYEMARECRLCPHRCGARRDGGETGRCGIGLTPRVASAGPHFGEEPELVGRGGSGTIFFGGCNLSCIFCQNAELSAGCAGTETPPEEIASLMLALQRQGCENVNVVTPTHVAPAVAAAVVAARARALTVPVVYNCGGYESVETLRHLDGLIEIYMPDAKYGPAAASGELSGAADYFARVTAALREMHRQVGDLKTDGRGVATRGLLVRHLVLPGGRADSEPVLRFLAEELSPRTYVNIMDQYRPCHRASEVPALGRPVTPEEVAAVKRVARELGLTRGFK